LQQHGKVIAQGFPTCGTRTTGGTRRSSRWYARTPFFRKNLDFTSF